MKSYDDSKLSNYILYLDVNDLHGWSVSQYLTHSKRKWSN